MPHPQPRTTLATAIFALALLASPAATEEAQPAPTAAAPAQADAPAAAQEAEPKAPPAEASPSSTAPAGHPPLAAPTASPPISDMKLQAFAEAWEEVRPYVETMRSKLRATEDADERLELRRQIDAHVQASVDAHPGIDYAEYRDIAMETLRDPELRKRLDAFVQKASKSRGDEPGNSERKNEDETRTSG